MILTQKIAIETQYQNDLLWDITVNLTNIKKLVSKSLKKFYQNQTTNVILVQLSNFGAKIVILRQLLI